LALQTDEFRTRNVSVHRGVRDESIDAERQLAALTGGVTVNRRLQPSIPSIGEAGDIAARPDGRSGEQIRVGHWVIAQQRRETVARNMPAFEEPFDEVPFFWITHFDPQINCVGHTSSRDEVRRPGDASPRDGAVSFGRDGRVPTVATVGRDRTCRSAEMVVDWDDAELEEALRRADSAARIGQD